MREDAALRWYVVHTQPQSEQKACAHLERQGFRSYCPRYQKRRRHARRVETVPTPLFPRYVFVTIDISSQRWRSIHSTVGVSRLVCHGETPAPVPAEVIAAIRRQEGPDGFIRLDDRPRFKAGDNIRVLDGVLAACTGVFEAVADRERVAILLELLGRKIRLVVDADSIAAA